MKLTLQLAIALSIVFAGCKPASKRVELPGYLEADLIEMASPESGYLADLLVHRGQFLEAGAPLYRLESPALELELVSASQHRLGAQKRAEDASVGEREENLRLLEANLAAQDAVVKLAKREYQRQASLTSVGATSKEHLEEAQSNLTQAEQKWKAFQAQLDLARKGQRPLQLEALGADVAALQASEATAQWHLNQLVRNAPVEAVVQDTLFQPGEWVSAGRPVVALRNVADLRARFFVTPEQAANLQLGDDVQVTLPGKAPPLTAKIVRLADQAEFTPPVIYSREQAARLVFMVEAQLPEQAARDLHPGLPVTIGIFHPAP